MARRKYSQKAMIKALKKSKGMITVAARSLGCSVETIRKYRKEFPAIEEAIQEEREQVIDVAELALHRAVLDGQAWAVCFTLKTVGKDRGYVERQQIEHSGGVEITVEDARARVLERVAALRKS